MLDSGALLFYTNDIEVGGIYALGGDISNIGVTISGSNGNKVYINNGGSFDVETIWTKNLFGLTGETAVTGYIDQAKINHIYAKEITTDDIIVQDIDAHYLRGDYLYLGSSSVSSINTVQVVTDVTYSETNNSINVTKEWIKCLA